MSASNTPRTDAVESKYDDEEYRAAVDCLILARYLERGLMELRAEFNAAVQVGASYKKQAARLREALAELVNRCDGDEGVLIDGSNIQTIGAHAALGDFDPETETTSDTARAALVQS
jgi:hypothetical protein